MNMKIQKSELIKLTEYIKNRSLLYNLSISNDGKFTAGDDDEPLSMRKLARYLIEDIKTNKVVKIDDKDLKKIVDLAIKGTKKAILSECGQVI